MRYACVIALLVVLAPVAAGAENADLVHGRALLGELEEQKALVVLQAALADPALSSAERAQVHLLMGLARANLLETDAAAAEFRAALDADATVAPPGDSSPKVLELFSKARADRAAAVAIATPPPAAGRGGLTTASWIGAGVGAALLGGGVYFGVAAAYGEDEAIAEPSARGAISRLDAARSDAGVANAFYVASGVLVATAAVLYVIDAPSSPSPPP